MKKVIIVIAAIIIIPYLIGAVITREELRQIENDANNPKSASSISLADGKVKFMEGCDDGSLNGTGFNQTTYCGCMYDTMAAEKGINWIANLGLNKTETEITTAMMPYAERCIAAQQV